MKKLKRILFVVVLLLLALVVYVEVANRKTKNMTYRQKLLKAFYPALMWFNKTAGKGATVATTTPAQPVVNFFTLKDTLNDGAPFEFAQLQGKKILLVNTASDCGYTDQYAELQKLHEQYGNRVTVIGFPANDFKEQEKGSDADIAAFCKKNYGVNFLLMKKSSVIKSAAQNSIFSWLSDAAQNGWNTRVPEWNFSKYIVNEKGVLTHYFGPGVSPLSETVIAAITAS
jgi:glutathione peroxidase